MTGNKLSMLTVKPELQKTGNRWMAKIEFVGAHWIWVAGNAGGQGCNSYGHFWIPKTWHSAHRAGWLLFRNPYLLPDIQVEHLCHLKACVNLDGHLAEATHMTNMLRTDTIITTRNLKKTHCDHGHPFSGSNLFIANGRRRCRECSRRRVKELYYRKKNNNN